MTTNEVAALIGSTASIIVATLAVTKFWMNRMDARVTHLVETSRKDLLKAIANNMEKQFADLDKTAYVTLDYRMDGDGDTQCLRIPLAYNRVTECLQGMRLQLVDHSKKETVYSISTLNFGAPIRLHWHYHEEMEMVQIIRGYCTDVQTGRRYGPGEVWIIEPGVRHIADFFNCYALATVRPPLPFASEKPIQLNGICGVYDSPEPELQPA